MAKYSYKGDGGFFAGLPACDLDEDELNDEQREILQNAGIPSGMYVKQEEAQDVESSEGDPVRRKRNSGS